MFLRVPLYFFVSFFEQFVKMIKNNKMRLEIIFGTFINYKPFFIFRVLDIPSLFDAINKIAKSRYLRNQYQVGKANNEKSSLKRSPPQPSAFTTSTAA